MGTQGLDFGAIVPGTLVNSHYLQFNTARTLIRLLLGVAHR